jgi:hypothetical protein
MRSKEAFAYCKSVTVVTATEAGAWPRCLRGSLMLQLSKNIRCFSTRLR